MEQIMKRLGAAYATPLVHNEMLIGLLVLSKKRNQQPLHQDEAAFIKNISGTLGLALSNAVMYQRIATLRDHLQRRTESLSMEIGERKRAEASLKAVQLELEEAYLSMEEAILQANEMTAKIEINNHVLTQEMEDRKKVERALRQSEQCYRLITENSADVIWSIDFEGNFTFMSPSVVHQLQYTAEEMLAMKIEDMLTPESFSVATETISRELERGHKPDAFARRNRTLELEQVRKDGTTFWTEVNTRFVLNDSGETVGVMGVTRDISERRKSEQALIYMANHDALTGLYNRKAFMEFLEQEVKYAKRYRSGLGLLFFDLNKFKRANDTFGHEIGDQLLKRVANRLSRVVRDSDMVARLGGDEFTILLKNPVSLVEEVVARRIAEDLSRPFEFDDVTVNFVSASIGIASFPEDGETADALMKNADFAMYKAKNRAIDWIRYSEVLSEAV
jgi:diguanylate cyclase (GGDEF)-like protein/PAS domain S-box-containing protein